MNYVTEWIDRRNDIHIIKDMTTHHIESIIKCMKGEGKSVIKNPYNGLQHSDWIQIFEEELKNRENINSFPIY